MGLKKCDVCGREATYTIRMGGRLSNGKGMTGPQLYGCKKHDLAKMKKKVIYGTKRQSD